MRVQGAFPERAPIDWRGGDCVAGAELFSGGRREGDGREQWSFLQALQLHSI